MAYPLPVTPQALIPPASRPLLAIGLLRDAAGSSRNYTSGVAQGALLRYVGLDSYAWWLDPDLSAPVRVHLSESLTGVFADAQIEVTHLPVDAATVELGDLRSIDTDITPEVPWYTWRVSSRADQTGLVTLTGETLLGRLARTRPREALILVAGQDGVPDPLDLRECLRRFLDYYGVPYDPNLPPFFLRAGNDNVVPTPPAFVIQPNQESPESLLEWLDRFFAPFRGYGFRADADDRLVVTPPAWVATMGLRLTLYRQQHLVFFYQERDTTSVPWAWAEPPTVTWAASVNGAPSSGALSDPLELDTPVDINLGELTIRVEWTSAGNITATRHPLPDPLEWPFPTLTYSFTATYRPDEADTEPLQLLPVDLAPEAVVTIDAERVVNQATVRVQAIDWQTGQQVMQAAALVLRSPQQLMAGVFGNNVPYGPMVEEPETPDGFLELANAVAQSGTWFWPVDAGVVMQPGGQINVAYEVEEWAEQWRTPSGPHAAAAQVNTYSDTAALPASGIEVKLFDFQFPRQTSNFAPGPYGARGSVYGRWVSGDTPGIQLRVGNSPRFAEFGFLWEGIGGQTVYFLWGFVLKLNGTGTTFTTGDTSVHRFGYTQEDGTWEGGADVPALSESQAAYPSRSLEVTLPYPVDEAEAIAIARGIVEENLHPRAVHQLTLVPSVQRGWPLTPEHVGRVVDVPSVGMQGRLISISYDEAHTPSGSLSTVQVELEETGVIPNTRAHVRTYAAGAYGRSTYQPED